MNLTPASSNLVIGIVLGIVWSAVFSYISLRMVFEREWGYAIFCVVFVVLLMRATRKRYRFLIQAVEP